MKISKKEKEQFLKETGISEESLKGYISRSKKKKTVSEVSYTLYSTSTYGKISNRFVKKLTDKLVVNYPSMFEPLYKSLRAAGINVLSSTYISMMFFSSFLAFIVVSVTASLLFKHPNIAVQVARGLMLGVTACAITWVAFYVYPGSVAKSREKAIKEDLPFMVINMAAIAGSGAKPISIFKTILSSEEYPGIKDEIKKIINYINLFGYDLPTALRGGGRHTRSVKFKDILDGIVNTTESGGDLKAYLTSVADETLNTYRLERKKAVEQIATYSDIYTTVLIAAPLLFFVTLAIIQTMGGQIGGISVATLATFGTYLAIPLLNIGFIVFLNAVQPK